MLHSSSFGSDLDWDFIVKKDKCLKDFQISFPTG